MEYCGELLKLAKCVRIYQSVVKSGRMWENALGCGEKWLNVAKNIRERLWRVVKSRRTSLKMLESGT